MKIMQFMLSRANGGAEMHFADMVMALHRHGIDQVVIANPLSDRYEDLRSAGVKLVLSHGWQAKSLIPRWYIRRAIAYEKPDIIQCWMRRAATMTPITAIPTIGWFGGYYDPANFASCKYFIGVTPGIVDHMVAKGVPPARAYCVNTFSSANDQAPASRAEIGTPDGVPVLLTLSRLHIKKGLDIAIKALASIPDCHLWIAGDGPLEAELKSLAGSTGVADRVKFLGWRSDRGALLRAADICLLPSRYEPFGTVILEAWQNRTPIISAMSAGPRETIRHADDGLMVPIDDVEALADSIRRILIEPELADRLTSRGSARYHGHFTEERAVGRLLSIYEGIHSATPMSVMPELVSVGSS
ncbi:glycosyltransferase [Skermanella sp. TT6]|uniref:Glycosyltransferase n=1 Tax=Skermanella cutis TaxID=2775420 RepID=A0ABX7BAZ7_9PROT|nr:glycosyltransferase [Skermanella sp. TT6]QQP91559.1 glycosyltransferase [Skermanella sp. TT6]